MRILKSDFTICLSHAEMEVIERALSKNWFSEDYGEMTSAEKFYIKERRDLIIKMRSQAADALEKATSQPPTQ